MFRNCLSGSTILLALALNIFIVQTDVSCTDSDTMNCKKIGTFCKDGVLEFVNSDGKELASINIEIADTLATRTIGLMGRTEMDYTMGMLFVFEMADYRVFWMRSTPLSLDIIFISEDKQVINIAQGTKPLSDSRYYSLGHARYVVEVLAGFSQRYGIGEGTKVRWQRD